MDTHDTAIHQEQLDEELFRLSLVAEDCRVTPDAFRATSGQLLAVFRTLGTQGANAMPWRVFRLCRTMRAWRSRTSDSAMAGCNSVPDGARSPHKPAAGRRIIVSTEAFWDEAERCVLWSCACEAYIRAEMAVKDGSPSARDLCDEAIRRAGLLPVSRAWHQFLRARADRLLWLLG
jgi:hypothetical protein